MKVFAYRPGGSGMQQLPIEPRKLDNEGKLLSVFIDVVLEDDRQVRLTVDSDGRVWVRTWGNVPLTLGNSPQSDLSLRVTCQEPDHNEHGIPLESHPSRKGGS